MEVANKTYAHRFVNLMRDVYTVEGGQEKYMQILAAESSGQIFERKPNNKLRAYDRKLFRPSNQGPVLLGNSRLFCDLYMSFRKYREQSYQS